uniref:BED-type domain-containing protein n=1 Tax=Ditylenchus dipsaci TaxID=166011 RepID=A0A915E7R6_9BILA
MSLLSDDSPNSGSKNSKKRMRDAVWQNFSEINDGEDIKMKCNECQQVVAKHKTSISSHWSYKHKDKMQPPRKISASSLDVSAEPTDRYKKIHAALSAVLSIPSMPMNIILHPLMRRLFHVMSPKFEVIRSRQFFVAQIYTAELICSFSLTCDVWTDSGLNNAYLGVTLHCTDSTATLRRICLGLQQLKGSHTGTLIRRETEKILSIYGLCTANAFKVVKYEEPQENTTRTTSFALNATLDQLLGELASENTNARKQKEIVQASAASRIRETMNRVLSASSQGWMR